MISKLFSFFIFLFFPLIAFGQSPERAIKLNKEKALAESCSGVLYRSKKADIPVYKETDLTSKVVYRLSLGEKVCYIGERGDFAILDWRSFLESEGEKVKEELAYARLVDLWPPRNTKKKKSQNLPGLAGFFSKARSVFQRMGYGHPPEDALEPYRPVLEQIEQVQTGKDPSKAKSSCEKEVPCQLEGKN